MGPNPMGDRAAGAGGVGGLHDPKAPSFKDLLMENLSKVNDLQRDATTAIEDLQTGQRNDVETVLMATAKADSAFRMLLAVRNKMIAAYDEIKQIRV
ncbi:MAG TPA: flagellar hook-basal body complex protein FliE [Phycisphaerales bacterium]|nr:flagellar hook-basal body complex protein FliE [Phycisphaerales bacterium]